MCSSGRYTRPMLFDRKKIYDGRVIQVSVDTVDLPNGVRLPLEIVRHPGGAAAVAIDADNRVCLLRQYRHAAGGYIYELPAGRLEPNEAPEITVRRELAEEAATSASRWESLGALFQFAGRVHGSDPPVPRDRSGTGHGCPGIRRGFSGRVVATRGGRRESVQRGTHRRKNNHRNSTSRIAPKNCVKRLTALNSGHRKW